MQQKESAILELRKVLEDGYKIQEEQNVFQVQRVARSDEPGFNSDSFKQYLRYGANGSIVYGSYTNGIKNIFKNFGLSFGRFRSNTETIDPKTDADNPAGQFVRQLGELDKIVNSDSYFKTYILPTAYAVVTFEDGVISQGYQEHKFRGDKHRELLYLLWDGRRIINSDGKVLRSEKAMPRKEVRQKVGIRDHESFKDIVRAIKIEMRRKDIKLDIKFPKDIFMVVTQDSM